MSSALFSPIEIGRMKLNNRIVVSPMCQYSAIDGDANEWHLGHLCNMALSGAGLLTLESTAVSPEGRITPSCLGLWADSNEAALARVLAVLRAISDVPLALQLGHAGRKASAEVPWRGRAQRAIDDGGWQTVAPSPVPLNRDDRTPLALDEAGLLKVEADFVAATVRAARLGFDMLELHGGHGYLLSSFVSPLSNHRDDSYGGTLENQLRFPLRVVRAVREAWPADRPLAIKINGTDWAEGGSTVEEVVTYAQELRRAGVDVVTASGGGVSSEQRVQPEPGYQLPAAASIRAETGVTTCAVGMIHDARQAEQIIAGGSADLVALARAMLYNPRWPFHAAVTLGHDMAWPPQYERAGPKAWKLARGI